MFDFGIFTRSKIFFLSIELFMISLYEEIIVVKHHFGKYVVWDNVSLAHSKARVKRGQLVLADQIVLVYTENNQISAHNIYF